MTRRMCRVKENLDSADNLKSIDNAVHESLSLSYHDFCKALEIADDAFSDLDCPWIKHCVKETIMRWYSLSVPKENDVYFWFAKNYKSRLGDEFEIISKKSNSKHKPDFWLSDGTFEYPVECKLHKFDNIALAQLQRYMNVYNCQFGVAVGSDLTAELPTNIIFVQFDYDDLTNEHVR